MGAREMTQTAPWPTTLQRIVDSLRYKADWWFELRDLDRHTSFRGEVDST